MPAENYVLLETIALTQSAASVTFDNLPTSGYTDLKVVHSARMTNTDSPVLLNFNGVTTGYSWRRLYGNGSSASSQSGSDGYFLHGNTSSMTANTFSNSEFYIPNYRSNQAKSISAESALETNATAGELFMHAVLWNNIAAITSFTMTPLTGSFAANSTFSLYGVAALGTTPTLAPKATGGNIVANDGTFWYHAFTSSGNFVPQVGLSCDVLTIAGGAGGGGQNSGGGGAGGFRYASNQPLNFGTLYSVAVGGGGAGGIAGPDPSGMGTNGQPSIFNAMSSAGGGGGAGGEQNRGYDALPGGSGGGTGGGGNNASPLGFGGNQGNTPTTTPSQGNNGGIWNGDFSGGGGGGAGAAGANATGSGSSSKGGAGGAGSNAFSSWATATGTGIGGFYAGGGGGYSGFTGSQTGGAGGSGGGGGGGSANNGPGAGTAGSQNTGSGGGGGQSPGGNGGSGVVIIRYPIA